MALDDKLVSIVLPTHNGAHYLANSVGSCIAQTYSNWELIIVDDASTDATPQIAQEFVKQDSRIRYFRHDKNRKLPGALNTGFSNAKGSYLTWTSDDNLYGPEAVSEMVSYLEANPGAGLVYCNYTNIDEHGNLLDAVDLFGPEQLWYTNCIGACFLYRREVYENIGNYAEDLFLAEDFDYWLRVSSFFRISKLSKNLYLYRRHDASLSETQKSAVISLAAEHAIYRNLTYMKWLDSDTRAKAYVNLVDKALTRKDRVAAFKYMFCSLRSSPSYIIRLQRPLIGNLVLGKSLNTLLFKVIRRLKSHFGSK